MRGGADLSSVTSIWTGFAEARGRAPCLEIAKGKTTRGCDDKSLPVKVSVVVPPICSPRGETSTSVGAASAPAERAKPRTKAKPNGRIVEGDEEASNFMIQSWALEVEY